MTGVLCPEGPYRVAIAELPLSAQPTDRPDGAIVVVPGAAAWPDAVLAAAQAGAAAIVVADPVFLSAIEIQRVIDEVGIPVIVERPLLRPDVSAAAPAARETASEASRPARMVVVDATARRSALGAVARDAVGWARVLMSEELEVVAVGGAQALLVAASGLSAAISVAVTARPGSGRIHAQALGEVITDVVVEGSAVRMSTSTEAGRLIAPAVFESSERLALRRALAAVGGASIRDLEELAADTVTADALLTARS
ncbi:hypothetical protein LG299_09360 [Microbacterium lacus]|uniref:hypothetical protein n=1 Tax=Microbacterium lacus TaxID=415217 RepID=UPI00384B4312